MQQCLFDNIPDSFIEKWQEIANLLANTIHVPAALIMKVENETMEVFTSSKTENNPYNIGDKENWHGLYCETVIKTQKKLKIPNALKDKDWDKNPDIKLGMIAYLGFPINFPDKTPFGTLCVLDREERQFTAEQEKILLQFKNTIELDLALICALELKQNGGQNEVIQKLLRSNEQYQVMHEEYLTANEELQQANDELEQAKRNAEENEQKFRLMYENSSMGIAMLSLNFTIVAANTAYCNMLGYSEQELIGKTLKDITYAESLPENLQLQNQLKQGEIASFQLEKEFIHKKGHKVYGLLNASVIKNPENQPLYFLGNVQHITEHKQVEKALRKSEATVRNKLKAILEPEGDIETLNLADIVDVDDLQALMEDFHQFSNICTAILDIQGNVLVAVGWQDICTKFHRVHPDTAKNCLESDLALASGVPAGTFKAYRCKNNMWDMVSPIEIGGKHLGNIYIGQFFYEDENIDYELFRKQAWQHGFDETEYMAALDRVPRLNRETVAGAMAFYGKFAAMMSSLSYSKIKLSRDNEQRKKAEKALQEKNDLLERVFDSNFDLVALTDLEGNFTLVGKSHEILGYDRDYLIGKNVMDFVHPDDVAQVGKEFTRFLQTSEDRMVEYRNRRSDGTYLWFETVGTILKDEKGNPEQILFNTRNITEKKQAEEAVHESEALLSDVMESIQDGISVLDPDLNIIRVNSVMEKWYESNIPLVGKKCFQCYHNAEKPCDPCPSLRCLKSGKTEVDIINGPPGSPIKWIELFSYPVKNQQTGDTIGLVEFVRDITERKQASEALRQSQELLNVTQQIAKIGGWVYDKKTESMTWADETYRIHGMDPDKFTSGSPEHIERSIACYDKEDQAKIETAFRHCVEDGTPYTFEFPITTVQGQQKWILTSAQAVLESGNVTKVYGHIMDISDRKQAEKALRENEEKMRSIYRVAPTGIGVVVNRVLKDVNPRVCEMTGYSREELVEKNARILYPTQEEYEFVGKEKYKQIKAKGTGEVETHWQQKNGTIINVWLASTPIDKNDLSKGVTFTALDITERKQAEEALKESEKRFHHVLRDIPWIAVQGYQFDGTVNYWNKASENLYGYTADEAFGRKLYELLIPPEMRENVRDEMRQMHETLKPAPSAELSLMRKNGSRVSVISSHAIVQRKGHAPELFCLDVDITDRKRAEMITALQYNIVRATMTTKKLDELFGFIQNELNSIIDARNFLIAIYNEETGMVHSPLFIDENDNYKEWPAEKTATGFVIKKGQTVLLKRKDTLKLKEEGLIEIVGTPSQAWLGVPLKVEEEILGVVAVQSYDNPDVYDQTSIEIMELVAHELSMFIDRQRSEEKVNKLSRAVEQSSVSVVITNSQGDIEYVNPFFTELTGYTYEEAMGKNPNILKSGHHSEAFYKELWDTILSDNDWEGEFLNKKKNGELYWEKAVISSIVNHEGVITNFVGIKEDITGRKKDEKELQFKNHISNIFINSTQQEFYKNVLDAFREFFVSQYGYFGYINDNGDLVSESLTKDVWDECQITDKTIIFPKEKWTGLWGNSLKTRMTLYQNGGLQLPGGACSTAKCHCSTHCYK